MSKVEYNAAIVSNRGAQDSRKTGQEKRERLISRYRNGQAHQYPMKMHEGPWAEGATANRELMKTAQREAHAIERAAMHPELSTAEYITLAAEWQQRFAEYKSTKKPGEKQFFSLYTYTYSHLYRELKAGKILDILKAKANAKAALYQSILPQIQSLIAGESDLIANMANIVAVLHNTFHFLWTGFYIVRDDKSSISNLQSSIKEENVQTTNDERLTTNELVLGPFQGPVACTRIPYNRGVCGQAWAQNRTLIVPNVHEFPGHIACSSASNSEIVVPIHRNNNPDASSPAPNADIIAVLDIDSADYNTFDLIDQKYLEQISL